MSQNFFLCSKTEKMFENYALPYFFLNLRFLFEKMKIGHL